MISLSEPSAWAKLFTAIACGIMSGVFFAFSTFVMKALGRLPAPEGIAAMQSINVFAVKSGFIAVFLGTTLACLYLAVVSFWRLADPASVHLIAGSAIYVLGCFVVTATCNVPMNDTLATLNPTDPSSATYWAEYLTRWTLWNHMRTAACTIATGLLIRGLG